MSYIAGNATLSYDEIKNLREKIIEKYNERTGSTISSSDKKFNSNLLNYEELLKSINSYLKESEYTFEELSSANALAVIFHRARFPEVKYERIRNHSLNIFYIYAHGMPRDEYFAKQISEDDFEPHEEDYKCVEGLWDLYWDDRGDFLKCVENRSEAILFKLKILINRNASVRYRSQKNWGHGKVTTSDVRMTLELQSEKDFKFLLVVLHTGTEIKDHDTPKYLPGIYLNVDKNSNVRAGRVVMVKSPNDVTSIDSSEFIDSFTNEAQVKFEANEIPDYNTLKQRLFKFFTAKDDVSLSNNKMAVHLNKLIR